MIVDTILLALRAIRRNSLRSLLTILGIVIGVAAVITMVTLGKGATLQVTSDISKLGSNMLMVRPGQDVRGGAHEAAPSFDYKDVAAIARDISSVAAVAPTASKNLQAIYGSENWSTSVIGTDNNYFFVRNWEIETGRRFTDNEMKSGTAVCLLGATVYKEIFGSMDPLETSIRLQKLSCKIIGTLKSKGQSSFGSDQDDIVLIPLRTFQRRISGNRDIDAIYLSARDSLSTEKAKLDTERLMRERRRIRTGQDDNFHVRNMQELVSTMTGTTRILTMLLAAVAAVSLLVGGIGIMNIMLVSVTERTREIGIRLAIGAREREVLMQFLVEAVVLSLLGGLVGILLGLATAAVGTQLLHVPFVFDPVITLIAFCFSGAVGIVFGYFPARQAARLNPIDALRHE
ncbi:ABC-type transporter, permease component [Desulforapulum autotrophicum HRM2]|uniref:ABC-type transporter, permease component n=1 Tax=Desulforapulum autotrophicum (strain ATCC 43914 / DSM 3382 / VKM B-1955 / HRM2) TaxID=177437 RepID=C0QAF5_DESAH|nr:ABC transporter permease [Desulforapulum autotrophicum]ACN14740.1 ABC-type transporter, permease component [Desulforapulum autotrophicum HRM2]